jgi:hypothetical protein
MTETLQLELASWEQVLRTLTTESTSEGWTAPERLMAAVQQTVAAYHRRILPRLKAEHDLVLPALPDSAAVAAVAAYHAIIEEELLRQVDQLEDLRRDLVRAGGSAELERRITETLAALRALAGVALRFGREVEATHLDRQSFAPSSM